MQEENQQEHKLFVEFIQTIKQGNHEKVQALIAKDSSLVNHLDKDIKEPPLYFAVLSQNDEQSQEMIKLLMRNGANINFKDSMDQSVLFYACRQNKHKCVDLLLNNGLSLEECDQYGQTPIFYAVSENKLDIVKKYATKEIVNHVDKLAEQTPLYYAAKKGHLQMCKLLIQNGAEITHLDRNNKTAADLARKNKYIQVAQYLSSQLKRHKDVTRFMQVSQSLEQSNMQKKVQTKKKEDSRPIRQTYKIVQLNEKGQPQDLTESAAKQLFKDHPQLQAYLANPEMIPQELIDKSNSEHWQKQATKVLSLCIKLKGSFWFQQPVDPQKYNIKDYFDIIEKPMDLSTLKKRLNHNCYSSVKQFAADMALIWQNCYKYNGDEHEISKCAKELQTSFKEYYVSYGLNKFQEIGEK